MDRPRQDKGRDAHRAVPQMDVAFNNEYTDVRRPGYNYMDPHAPSRKDKNQVGEPKKFPEIPSDPLNRVYGEPWTDAPTTPDR